MRKLVIPFLIFIWFLSAAPSETGASQQHQGPRIEKKINSNWTFNYFPGDEMESGCEAPGFNDSAWPLISIPHTWSTCETTGDEDPFIGNQDERENPYWWTGWGWYRKRFGINTGIGTRKVFVEFEGVHKYCKVWINGHYLGDHKGGYGSFDFDITEHLVPGNENVLAVAVSNVQNDSYGIPPMAAADINLYGGIWNNVNLVIKDKLYIPMQGSASHEGGTFITTPQITEKAGIVRVRTWVRSDNPVPESCVLYTSINDAEGNSSRTVKSKHTIQPGETFMFDQTLKPVKNPHLWSPDDPYMYEVRSEVSAGGKETDVFSSPLGFRWFNWNDNENSLYINGKKTIINGTVLKHEYPWIGSAIPEWITEAVFNDLKHNKNYNLIRVSYFSAGPFQCELADRQGIIISMEAPVTGSPAFSADVQDQMLKEMIRRHRNHPSVMFWGLGNDTDHPASRPTATSEDNTRIFTAFRIKGAEETIHSFEKISTPDKISEKYTPPVLFDASPRKMGSGEPAKLSLNTSQEKITAGRNSLVVVTADITNAQGNPLINPTIAVRWSVEGPATLVGPQVYEPDMGQTPGAAAWTDEFPAFNLLRSTGEPGEIRITASASGLASGSMTVNAVAGSTDNSIISEPFPEERGRNPVTRPYFYVSRLEDVPREIELIRNNLTFKGENEAGFSSAIKRYIAANNTGLDTTTVEFSTLASLLASYLVRNDGNISANDYNFTIDQYNNCRMISGYVEATRLPPLFKHTLREYYSGEMIIRGREKNAGDEMNWLNWIPSGGTVVVSQTGKLPAWPKGTIITDKTALGDLISAVYPVFVRYGPDARERALTFTGKMNPYITVEEHGEGDSKTITYTAERGRPILIPLIKFISE